MNKHEQVLDMCAAPGSKTAQLIEMLHHGASEHDQGGFCDGDDHNIKNNNDDNNNNDGYDNELILVIIIIRIMITIIIIIKTNKS